MTRRAQLLARGALLVGLLAVGVWLKSGFVMEYGWGADGQYYLHLAQHVRDGDGLVSRVSLYHQGFQSFPHRVNQAPLWPVLLGLAGRVGSLDALQRSLPEWLYFLDLLLVYWLGNRLWRRVAPGAALPGAKRFGVPDFGHVAVVLLAFNPVFFRFTSAPYSEALAFGLLLVALLALDRAIAPRGTGFAFLSGVAAAAALLARGQMLALALAVVMSFGFVALMRRRDWALPIAAVVGIAVVMTPWVMYLASWVPALTPTVVLGMATQPQTPGLSTFSFWVPTDGLVDYLRDRLGGLAIAFTPGHRWSYFKSHGPAVALVPLAVIVVGVASLRAPGAWRAWLTPERALLLALVLAGVGMLAPVHHAHSKYLFEWLFAHRHGLPFVLLLLAATAALCAMPRRTWGVLAMIVVLFGAGSGATAIHGSARLSPLDDWHRALASWVDARETPPVVITTMPSALALVSKRGHFHWIACKEPPEALARLLDDAGGTHVVVHPSEVYCEFLAGAGNRLETEKIFGEGKLVLLRKRQEGSRGLPEPALGR